MCMKKTIHTTPVVFVILVAIFCGFAAQGWANDDPNVFNQTMGISAMSSGAATADYSCGWIVAAVRNGTAEEGSDGGQLTIELNTCQIFDYEIERFPQSGGAGGTADLEPEDVIIVWDEDLTHGEYESQKNFSFTGTYDKLIESEYEDYLRLTSTDNVTNWGIYLVETAGTFTKGSAGTNEHETLHLTRNIMQFWKEDDISDANCVSPGDTITYSICWNNDSGETVSGAYIIDWLPDGVDYDYIISVDPWVLDDNYNIQEHYYRWELDDIDPNDSDCLQLQVTVNTDAVSGYYLHNIAEMYIDGDVVAADDEFTLVCCWDTDGILYVDQTATNGANTGTSWDDAYLDLADALVRARDTICEDPYVIYVAQGTYDPNNAAEYTFRIPDEVAVYGGFKSGGCDFTERNPKRYKTTLTGLINEQAITFKLVAMGDETLLDGFTVTNAFEQAVYGDGVDFTVSHCTIEKNYRYGIYAKNGNASIEWCTVRSNEMDGMYHEGEGYTLTVNNSWILRNGECGIRCEYSTPTVKNSIVSESDLTAQGRAGIRLLNPTSTPVLYNLTVANNREAGIYFADDRTISDPNDKDYPDLQNTIVYYNNPGGSQLRGFSADNIANFCCIQDCNEPGTTNFNDEPGFAYAVDPNGTPDPNNYHLSATAFCIDKGNDLDLDYTGQVDIDGEGLDRQYGDAVDIGADEVYDCDDNIETPAEVHNDFDWDADGIVNLVEFSKFSRAWLSRDPNEFGDPNLADPNDFINWSEKCNLDDTGASEYVH